MKYFFLIILIVFWAIKSLAQEHLIEFVTVPKGWYWVGSKNDVANPKRKVYTEGFQISKYEITNNQFNSFVLATGYKTTAELKHTARIYRKNSPEYYWHRDTSASWRYPQGRNMAGLDSLLNHPVTCVTIHDARAFCEFYGLKLPGFDEWEIACRAKGKSEYHWGKSHKKARQYANIWHAKNHTVEDVSDGYAFTAPVGSFKPNAWGLFDMAGNVFELCEGTLPRDSPRTAHARGGSWWCSLYSCRFFNCVDIGSYVDDAAFSNIGFRVIKPNTK
ncbi:MAG: formylglycine-generating enzyme family protein [Bacteroidia bacterium]|jgi:sulfatase modifying factor 1